MSWIGTGGVSRKAHGVRVKVSIVTISYNQAPFLEETLRSVLDQDHKTVEYIVVDPGSIDGSRAIIDNYRERIARIIYEPDSGPADGLNKGFASAAGEVFGFLNSDDVLERGALSRVTQFFMAHPDVDVVSGHSWIIDAEGRRRRRFYSDRYSLRMAAYGASILSQASTFFRSEVFRRVGGFNAKNRLTWDAEFFLDMALAGARFSLVPEFWSRFRVHAESITGSGIVRKRDHGAVASTYRKVMGREPGSCYPMVAFLARYARKILNPLDTFERLLRGPIA